MRINCYCFPDTMGEHERFKNGAMNIEGHCTKGIEECKGCPHSTGFYIDCEFFHCDESETDIEGITVTKAKKFLKEFGGSAYTKHCDRSGSCFEISEITLKGNNSRFKYNHHL